MDKVSLMYKVLSGEAAPSEQKELADWIAESEANSEEFEDIKLLWESSVSSTDAYDENDSGFEKIRQRVKQRLKAKSRLKHVLYAIALAGAVLIFVLLTKWTWFSSSDGVRFHRTGLNQVIKALEKSYDIKIDVNNTEIGKCQLTATFYRVDDERRTLEAIEHALNVEFVVQSKNKFRLKKSSN